MDYGVVLYVVLVTFVHPGATAGLPIVTVDQLCAQVKLMNCDTDYVGHEDEQTCGMDGVTYENFCYYAKARCSNVNLGIANIGRCIENDPISTQPPDHTTTPHPDVIVQFFCKNADNIDCTLEERDLYCGTNGVLYQNMCAVAKAQCTEPDLNTQSLHLCNDHSNIIGK